MNTTGWPAGWLAVRPDITGPPDLSIGRTETAGFLLVSADTVHDVRKIILQHGLGWTSFIYTQQNTDTDFILNKDLSDAVYYRLWFM